MDDMFGSVKPDSELGNVFGDVARDGAAELGIEKGQGSPWKKCPAERP